MQSWPGRGESPAPRSHPPRTVPRIGRPAGAGEAAEVDAVGALATRTLRKKTRAKRALAKTSRARKRLVKTRRARARAQPTMGPPQAARARAGELPGPG